MLIQEESESWIFERCLKGYLKGGYSQNKMWSLKSLVMLKFESRSSLHAAQYK